MNDWTPLDLPSGQVYGSGETGIYVKYRPDYADPDLNWEVFIPPTRAEHFEGFTPEDTATPEELHEAAILGPWGVTYWPTFADAAAFLQQCIENGDVVPRAPQPSPFIIEQSLTTKGRHHV